MHHLKVLSSSLGKVDSPSPAQEACNTSWLLKGLFSYIFKSYMVPSHQLNSKNNALVLLLKTIL